MTLKSKLKGYITNLYQLWYILDTKDKKNFKNIFNEHRKDFVISTGKYKFSLHTLNAGHEMPSLDEIMTILRLENYSKMNQSSWRNRDYEVTFDCMLNTIQNGTSFTKYDHSTIRQRGPEDALVRARHTTSIIAFSQPMTWTLIW